MAVPLTIRWIAFAALSLGFAATPTRAQWRGDAPYRGEAYRPIERTTFLVGGIGYWGLDLPFGTTWTVGAGMEFPVNSWSLVSRLDIEGNDGASASGLLQRVALEGRITTLLASHASYVEAGFGLQHSEVTQVDFGGARSSDSVFSPCFVVGVGTMSDPHERPSLLLEAQLVHATNANAPGSLLGRVGIRF